MPLHTAHSNVVVPKLLLIFKTFDIYCHIFM